MLDRIRVDHLCSNQNFKQNAVGRLRLNCESIAGCRIAVHDQFVQTRTAFDKVATITNVPDNHVVIGTSVKLIRTRPAGDQVVAVTA